MDDTRDVTQDRQDDVDEEIGITSSLEEDTEGRNEDGKDLKSCVLASCDFPRGQGENELEIATYDLADVRRGENHLD